MSTADEATPSEPSRGAAGSARSPSTDEDAAVSQCGRASVTADAIELRDADGLVVNTIPRITDEMMRAAIQSIIDRHFPGEEFD